MRLFLACALLWTSLLQRYDDPARGVDYAHLKQHDAATLEHLRQDLGRVNLGELDRRDQLAYWINVYNVNVVATIVENYPTKSIRDLSTDPIRRLNVFTKPRVPFGNELLSLDDVENKKIREGFHDPRIHFAINCAAKSCPPIRPEAYAGEKIGPQLDEQVRRFLATARFAKNDGALTIRTTKILDWFNDDFEKWGGGKTLFVRRFVSPEKQKMIDEANGHVTFVYDDYDWSLNSQ